MKTFNVQNQVALVTGTNKKNGIGRAIVLALLQAGARKVYATARNVDELQDLVQEHNGKVVAVQLDVTDLTAIQQLPTLYPDVTLIVNNAGYLSNTPNSLTEIDVTKVEREIQVNYLAPLALVSRFAPLLQQASQSAVVNIASIASLVNFPIAGTYSASKAAAHSLTQAQRRDLPRTLVLGIYPGPIDTAMAEEIAFETSTPPSAVAQAVVRALEQGQEDVFPDAMAKQVFDGWKADAKQMEVNMAAQAAAAAAQ